MHRARTCGGACCPRVCWHVRSRSAPRARRYDGVPPLENVPEADKQVAMAEIIANITAAAVEQVAAEVPMVNLTVVGNSGIVIEKPAENPADPPPACNLTLTKVQSTEAGVELEATYTQGATPRSNIDIALQLIAGGKFLCAFTPATPGVLNAGRTDANGAVRVLCSFGARPVPESQVFTAEAPDLANLAQKLTADVTVTGAQRAARAAGALRTRPQPPLLCDCSNTNASVGLPLPPSLPPQTSAPAPWPSPTSP